MEAPSRDDGEVVALSKQESRAVEAVYDKLITSVCIDVACGMHRLVKTGVIPYAEVMIPRNRHEVYPMLNDGESSSSISNHEPYEPASKKVRFLSSRDSNEIPKGESESIPSAPAFQARETRGSGNDIWGRIPPKEPKYSARCSVCGRQVSTLRFAPHLDKCMGIGTTTRGAANGANNNAGTRSGMK